MWTELGRLNTRVPPHATLRGWSELAPQGEVNTLLMLRCEPLGASKHTGEITARDVPRVLSLRAPVFQPAAEDYHRARF
jgi:hypothetical protein